MIGGIVISGYSEGSAIANTALKIIAGVAPQTIPVSSTGSNRGIFNYPRLQQYGIDEQQLPPNSMVINRPFSLYEEYYSQVWLIIGFIGVLLLIIVLLVINITKRRLAERALKSSEQNFRAFFEMASVGVAQLDIRSWKYIKINQKYSDIVGFGIEELQSLTSDTITHPDDLDYQQHQMQLLLDGQIPEFTIEKRYIQKNGTLTVSVNISARQFTGQDLFTLLQDVLHDTGLEPGRLYLEVTESMVMGDLASGQRIMGALRELGAKFYLDDFGTGYSSLAYLKRLPIDGLKIDRSFVKDIVEDPDSEAIAAAITSLANTLNLQIVAEGVETTEQWKMLHGMSEMLIQGYLVSKPVPADKFELLFKKGDIIWHEGAR